MSTFKYKANHGKAWYLCVLALNFVLSFLISLAISKSWHGVESETANDPDQTGSKIRIDSKRRPSSATKHESLVYAGVYEKILSGRYGDTDKMALKAQWFGEWLAKDPREAITFYYKNRRELKDVTLLLREYYQANGDKVAGDLSAGYFGLRSNEVAGDLFSCGAKIDPNRVVGFITVSGTESRKLALNYLLKGFDSSSSGVESAIKLFEEFEDEQIKAEGFSVLGAKLRSENPGAIKELLLSGSINPETREYANLMKEYAGNLSKLSVTDIIEAGAEFPESVRDKLTNEAFTQKLPYAMRSAESLIESADSLIKGGKYDTVNQWIKAGSANHLDSVSLSEWALKLPQDSRHEEIFRSAISGYLEEDPVFGRDWVEKFENSWQRSQAMRELARLTKYKPKYVEVYQWAEKESSNANGNP